MPDGMNSDDGGVSQARMCSEDGGVSKASSSSGLTEAERRLVPVQAEKACSFPVSLSPTPTLGSLSCHGDREESCRGSNGGDDHSLERDDLVKCDPRHCRSMVNSKCQILANDRLS